MTTTPLADIAAKMHSHGAHTIIFKLLSNNDNSKQQIYMASDFEMLRKLPIGEIKAGGVSVNKGAMFKAALSFYWMDYSSALAVAKNAKLILYPDYPEVRLSGFLSGCSSAPSRLMQPLKPKERALRLAQKRCLVLGICQNRLIAYVSSWDDALSMEANSLVQQQKTPVFSSVFYEYRYGQNDSENVLIRRLQQLYCQGYVLSQKLNKQGEPEYYRAQNGAGYTLESYFKIRPNGVPEPDFLDWELKAHSGSVITLMTPEPDMGLYFQDNKAFMRKFATNIQADRLDFCGIHSVGQLNQKTGLLLGLEGYDIKDFKIVDPSLGLILRDFQNNIVAGWSFSKLLEHWKKKHNRTCYVSYSKKVCEENTNYYQFGPEITIATGANLKRFFNGFTDKHIYYDPGNKMVLNKSTGNWPMKNRNQLRVKWKNIEYLYESVRKVWLDKV